FQMANVGDLPTTLDTNSQDLFSIFIAAGGALTPGTPTSSDPNITCTATSSTNAVLLTCRGNLAAGQALTITMTVSGVSGDLFASETLDPSDLVLEGSETNNFLQESIVVM